MPYAAKKHMPNNCCRKNADDNRPSAYRRGYDRKWRRFRDWYLASHPLCMDCAKLCVVEPSTEVHHIVKVADDKSKMMDEDNVMSLCKSCHSARTARGE